jgi:hypothetical protein
VREQVQELSPQLQVQGQEQEPLVPPQQQQAAALLALARGLAPAQVQEQPLQLVLASQLLQSPCVASALQPRSAPYTAA